MSRAPHSRNTGSLRIAVIGAGVIGLACALELRRRGAEVTVYERGTELGGGATIRAAGMLGLASEAAQETEAPSVFGLAHRAALVWPDFVAEVVRHGGGLAGYSTDGAIMVARTGAETGGLQMLAAACQARGLPADWLEPQDLARREPAISGPVAAALLLTSDSQVDAAVLLQRLGAAASRAGVGLRLGRAVERISTGAHFTLPDGDRFDRVLLATGASPVTVRFEGRPGVTVEHGPCACCSGQGSDAGAGPCGRRAAPCDPDARRPMSRPRTAGFWSAQPLNAASMTRPWIPRFRAGYGQRRRALWACLAMPPKSAPGPGVRPVIARRCADDRRERHPGRVCGPRPLSQRHPACPGDGGNHRRSDA